MSAAPAAGVTGSGGDRGWCQAPELEQVVTWRDELPFGRAGRQAAALEAVDTPQDLGVGEDGLDDLLLGGDRAPGLQGYQGCVRPVGPRDPVVARACAVRCLYGISLERLTGMLWRGRIGARKLRLDRRGACATHPAAGSEPARAPRSRPVRTVRRGGRRRCPSAAGRCLVACRRCPSTAPGQLARARPATLNS